METTPTIRKIEKAYKKPLRAVLIDLFEELHTAEAVASELEISHPTLVKWLDGCHLKRVKQVIHMTRLQESDETLTLAS